MTTELEHLPGRSSASVSRACVSVLGVPCFVGDVREAGEQVVARAQGEGGGYVCQANAHVLVSACHDQTLRVALDGAWSVNPDGWPVAWVARRHGSAAAQKIAGADLMCEVLALGSPIGLKHYLYGSTVDVLRRLERNLTDAHPGACIVGALSPPFVQVSDEETHEMLTTIRESEPDVVWVALGAPKQELWMSRYAHLLTPAVAVGVGAAFDFLAGTKRRAPRWMQRHGLEWAHRFMSEPRRLAGRYARTNSEFMIRAALDLIAARRTS